jgi:hypothetical protein
MLVFGVTSGSAVSIFDAFVGISGLAILNLANLDLLSGTIGAILSGAECLMVVETIEGKVGDGLKEFVS